MKFNGSDYLRTGTERDKFVLHELMKSRFRERKPVEYRINLVSMSRLGYSFARQLLDDMKSDPSFKELNIWHRIARKIEHGQAVDVSPQESKAKMHEELLDIMTGEGGKVKFSEYRSLHDLEEIVRTSQKSPSIGDITVIASRYDFSFDLRDEKGGVLRPLDISSPADCSLIESIIQTSVYDTSGSTKAVMKRISEERELMRQIVEKVIKETGLNRERAENLIDSVIGIRELAKAFNGYRGNTIIAANEVDTTDYVFAKQSHTDPRKTLGLSHNDQLRYEKFLKGELKRPLRKLPIYAPVVGSHNEFLTAVEDLIRIADDPLCDATEKRIDFEKVRKKVADFGHRVYDARGASDEDAPKALLNMVSSIIYEDLRDCHIVRASARFGQEDFFTGMQVKHDAELAIPDMSFLRLMSPSEREVFERGNEIQKYINQLLIENGIIPREWDYEEIEIPLATAAERVVFVSEPGAETQQKVRDLERKIVESLDSRIYLSSRNHKRRFTRYSLNHSLTPSTLEFELSLQNVVGRASMVREHERMKLGGFVVTGDEIYAVSERRHGANRMEYRLFKYDRKSNRARFISEPISGDARDFRLRDFCISGNKVYFLKFENGKTSLDVYDADHNILQSLDYSQLGSGSVIAYKNGLIVSSEKDFYFFDGNRIKKPPVHSSEKRAGGVRKVSDAYDILFYNLPEQHKIIAKDLDGKLTQEFDTEYNAFDFVEMDNGAVQIITLSNEGIVVTTYASKKDLFKGKGKTYQLKEPLLRDSLKLWGQDGSVLFAAKEPGVFYAVYHEKGDFCIRGIKDIQDFSSLGGLVR